MTHDNHEPLPPRPESHALGHPSDALPSPGRTLFRQDVLGIPKAIEGTVDAVERTVGPLARELLERGARRFVAVGGGTSYFAAVSSLQTHDSLAPGRGTTVQACATGEFRRYPLPLSSEDCVVGISASGEVADLLDLFRDIGDSHQLVGLTNSPTSSLARLCRHVVTTRAGEPLVPTSTGTYVASVAALSLLWLAVLEVEGVTQATVARQALRAASQSAAIALEALSPAVADEARRLAACTHVLICGSGAGYGLAQEAALVFMEVVNMPAHALPLAELAHGMIAMAGPRTGLIVLDPAEGRAPSVASTIAQFEAAGSPVVMLAPPAAEAPTGGPLLPLILAGPLFALADEVALLRGTDPDRPGWEAQYLQAVRRPTTNSSGPA